MLPGQLVDLPFQERYAFCEIRRRDVDFLQYLARLKLHAAETRTALLSGAFQ